MQHCLRYTRLLHVFTTLIIAFSSLEASAQSDPVKFGKIEMADLQMKSYDKDTTAEAVVLCDFGQANFEYNNEKGFQIKFERVVRIKILKKSGYDWATGEIPLYKASGQGEEKVIDLKGYTYNLQNGTVVKEKLTKEAIFLEQKDENFFIQKFTLPNVREGSVVEYTYTVVSDFLYAFQDWTFQSTIPTVWSEYRAVIPEYFKYKMQIYGYEGFHTSSQDSKQVDFTIRVGGYSTTTSGFSPPERTQTSYERVTARATTYRWITKDVPGIRTEAFITTPRDYLTRIEFELSSTNFPGQGYKPYASSWNSLNSQLLQSENFGLQLKRAGFMKDVIAKIKAEKKEPLQQALAAYEFIRQHMKWNGEVSRYSNGTKKAFDNRTGNSADINLMLTAMLQEMNLNARPVLVSTRNHGRVLPYYAMLTKFNYVITYVNIDNQTLLLDATDAYLVPGMLPTHCLNGIGRLIDAKGGDWVSLETKEKAAEVVSAWMTVNEDGELTGRLEKSLGGYDGWTHRKQILSAGKEKHTENVKKEHPNWQITKVEVANLEKVTEALSEKIELTMGEVCQKAGNILYLKPMLSEGWKESPFKLTERKYPVDFAMPQEKTYVATITIPAGYKVEEMPKNALISLPENAGRFSFMVAANGNTLQITSRVSIRKPVFYAEEYDALREFYSLVVSKHAEQVVLKKI